MVYDYIVSPWWAWKCSLNRNSQLASPPPCMPAAAWPRLVLADLTHNHRTAACLFNFRSVSGDVFQGGGVADGGMAGQ